MSAGAELGRYILQHTLQKIPKIQWVGQWLHMELKHNNWVKSRPPPIPLFSESKEACCRKRGPAPRAPCISSTALA